MHHEAFLEALLGDNVGFNVKKLHLSNCWVVGKGLGFGEDK